jgi:putative GTP pyrophosphokinase
MLLGERKKDQHTIMKINPEEFLAAYEAYVDSDVVTAERSLHTLLREWRGPAFWESHRSSGNPLPNPIQSFRVRVKRPESVLDKIVRLGPREFPRNDIAASLRKMRDILGGRIITFVPGHLQLIDTAIRDSSTLRLTQPAPRAYLHIAELQRIGIEPDGFEYKSRKPSGYSSLHYFVQVRLESGEWSIPFELQVRTMIEEVWGEIEHQLGYKSGQKTEFSVSRQFRVIASHLSAIDEHFDFLYDRLSFLQTQTQVDDSSILNAENLPSILASYEIPLSQDEVGSLLQILVVWGVRTAGALRGRLSPERLELIRRVVRTSGLSPNASAFHVLTTVAMVEKRAKLDDVERQLRTNLAMVEMTRRRRDTGRP